MRKVRASLVIHKYWVGIVRCQQLPIEVDEAHRSSFLPKSLPIILTSIHDRRGQCVKTDLATLYQQVLARSVQSLVSGSSPFCSGPTTLLPGVKHTKLESLGKGSTLKRCGHLLCQFTNQSLHSHCGQRPFSDLLYTDTFFCKIKHKRISRKTMKIHTKDIWQCLVFDFYDLRMSGEMLLSFSGWGPETLPNILAQGSPIPHHQKNYLVELCQICPAICQQGHG